MSKPCAAIVRRFAAIVILTLAVGLAPVAAGAAGLSPETAEKDRLGAAVIQAIVPDMAASLAGEVGSDSKLAAIANRPDWPALLNEAMAEEAPVAAPRIALVFAHYAFKGLTIPELRAGLAAIESPAGQAALRHESPAGDADPLGTALNATPEGRSFAVKLEAVFKAPTDPAMMRAAMQAMGPGVFRRFGAKIEAEERRRLLGAPIKAGEVSPRLMSVVFEALGVEQRVRETLRDWGGGLAGEKYPHGWDTLLEDAFDRALVDDGQDLYAGFAPALSVYFAPEELSVGAALTDTAEGKAVVTALVAGSPLAASDKRALSRLRATAAGRGFADKVARLERMPWAEGAHSYSAMLFARSLQRFADSAEARALD